MANNIWNTNPVITPVQEQQLLYQYFNHKSQVQNIKYAKKTFINNKEPFGLNTKPISVTSRPEKLRQNEINQENKILISKMISINKCISPYSVEAFEQSRGCLYKPSNIGQKILNMRQLIDDNEGIEKRIKDAEPVVNMDKLKNEYKLTKKYKKNIMSNSRRIYNCFLTNTQTSFSTSKIPIIDKFLQQEQIIRSKSQEKMKAMKPKRKKKVNKLQQLEFENGQSNELQIKIEEILNMGKQHELSDNEEPLKIKLNNLKEVSVKNIEYKKQSIKDQQLQTSIQNKNNEDELDGAK